MSQSKRFFIIDGYAVLFRAHYALIRNPLITTYGLHTSALFGFSNQILKIIKDENPDYLACAFDTKGKNFRHKLYEKYKANRSEMPDEMQSQLPHLWEILDKMRIPVFKKEGYEADDIIGSLATDAEKQGFSTYIVSGDKDFMQLVNDKIFLYSPGNKKNPGPIIYTSKLVEERWGVEPDKIIDLLGLMGDSSDNVPGVSGVGEKTASKLLRKYGTLENIFKNIERITNKRAYNGLKNGIEDAKLSKKLVTIVTSLDLSYNIKDLKIKSIDFKKCSEKFSELEFHALVKKLHSNYEKKDNKNTTNTKKKYNIILNRKDLDQLIIKLENSDKISYDVCALSSSPMSSEIIGISFSIKPNSGFYVPFIYKGKKENNFDKNGDLNYVMKKFENIFSNSNKKKIGKNIKFNSLIFKKYGIDTEGIHFDILLAAHLLKPDSRSINLRSLSLDYLNYEKSSYQDLIGKGRDRKTIDQIPLKEFAFYAIEVADIILQLNEILRSKLKESKLDNYFFDIEMPLIKVLIEMEYFGTFVDSKFLGKMSEDINKNLKKLSNSIFKVSKEEFNINSTQQLANVLFDVLELPQLKKRSTAEDILRKLQKYHELPKMILEYRKFNKLKNTYVDSLPGLINDHTGRIHTTFNQTIAATGRLSSTKPNFQNIPARTDEGREIRKSFRAKDNSWKILSADYSQIELRIMAHLSKDKTLTYAFLNKEDVHSQTASNVFNVDINDVTPEMRRTSKIVNFGIMYGAGPFRMSQELGIPINEASEIIRMYFIKYPGIKNYINNTIEKARIQKYVETILGRKRSVWDIQSNNNLHRKSAERMAINMPIQGSAAEMIKLAMISIGENITQMGMESKLVLQIHDELLFEFPVHEQETLLKLVIDEMENAIKLSVPIIVDHGIGNNWYDAH